MIFMYTSVFEIIAIKFDCLSTIIVAIKKIMTKTRSQNPTTVPIKILNGNISRINDKFMNGVKSTAIVSKRIESAHIDCNNFVMKFIQTSLFVLEKQMPNAENVIQNKFENDVDWAVKKMNDPESNCT